MEREDGHNKQLLKSADIAIESFKRASTANSQSYLDGVGPEEEMLKPYVSPQTPFVFKYPPEIKEEEGIKKFREIINNTDVERENRRKEQLLKEVLFRFISRSARHLAFNYPIKIRRGYLKSNDISRDIPTENLIFPELETNFSANGRKDGNEAEFRLKFYNEKKKRKRGRNVYKPGKTKISITTNIPPDKSSVFSIQYNSKVRLPKELRYYPPVSMDRWGPKMGLYTRPLEIRDLKSFWESMEFVLTKVDPQYLLELKEQELYADYKIAVGLLGY